jgi:hypothetical protein
MKALVKLSADRLETPSPFSKRKISLNFRLKLWTPRLVNT